MSGPPSPAGMNIPLMVSDEAPRQLAAKKAEREKLCEALHDLCRDIAHLEALLLIGGFTP